MSVHQEPPFQDDDDPEQDTASASSWTIIGWDGDHDKANPYNWPAWKTNTYCSLLSFLAFLIPLASCGFFPSTFPSRNLIYTSTRFWTDVVCNCFRSHHRTSHASDYGRIRKHQHRAGSVSCVDLRAGGMLFFMRHRSKEGRTRRLTHRLTQPLFARS